MRVHSGMQASRVVGPASSDSGICFGSDSGSDSVALICGHLLGLLDSGSGSGSGSALTLALALGSALLASRRKSRSRMRQQEERSSSTSSVFFSIPIELDGVRHRSPVAQRAMRSV